MCPSPIFSERGRARLSAFVRRHPFATIVVKTKDAVPVVAHLPCLLDDDPAPWGTLRFHVARSNGTDGVDRIDAGDGDDREMAADMGNLAPGSAP